MIAKKTINQGTERRPRSAKLTKVELRALGKMIREKGTRIDAAEAIGIHRNILRTLLITGSASPETIKKVRCAIAA